MYWTYHYMILIVWINILDVCQPIMVKFGTSDEIIPYKESTSSGSIQARSIVPSHPAPVTEIAADIPNPNQYRPTNPKQYRTKLYSFKQEPNLILKPSYRFQPFALDAYNLYRMEHSRKLGPNYNGPHQFERQAYEFIKPQKTYWESPVKYAEVKKLRKYQNQKLVPQLGVVPTVAGVRYYVPNEYYVHKNQESSIDENSVYDRDEKTYFA